MFRYESPLKEGKPASAEHTTNQNAEFRAWPAATSALKFSLEIHIRENIFYLSLSQPPNSQISECSSLKSFFCPTN